MNQRHLLRATALAAASLLLAGLGQAQDFPPNKPVTLVVGFAPGGAADAAARLIARKLGDNIGQKVVVDNKAGAGGNIAHQLVAAGPADGSMLLFGSIGPLTIAPHVMKVRYDPFKDLAPVSGGVNFPNVLVVNKGVGVKTLAEFVALAKKKPGSIDFASTGAGSASHLAGELFNQRAGIDMVHVPYKGGAPALQDLLGERVASYFSAPPTALPQIEAGNLIPLATTSFAGWVAGKERGSVTTWIIRRFVAKYGVDMGEALDSDIASYPSFNAFFTRALKPGARPLAQADLVSPVDGAISQFGAIEGDRIFQAKGHRYSTTALVGGDATLAAQFEHGSFATL